MTFNDEVSSIQSETYVRSSSPSHRLLTSSYCSSSSWLYLLSWVRNHLITAALFRRGPSVSRGNRIFCHTMCLTVLLCPPRFLPLLYKHLWPGMLSVVLSLFSSPLVLCVYSSVMTVLFPSHHSTSALWRTASSVCLCCWPQQSKLSRTRVHRPIKRSLTVTHRVQAVVFIFEHLWIIFSFNPSLTLVVSLMWWCQHTPRTAGPVSSSSFTSP